MMKKSDIFIGTLKKDLALFKNMSDSQLENYIFNFLKTLHGDYDFKTSFCNTTLIHSQYVEEAILNNNIPFENYNNNDKYIVLSTKDFSKIVINSYRRKLRSGRLWLVLF